LSESCSNNAADDIGSMFPLCFDLKIERFVSENECNTALVKVCSCSCKYRVALRRSRVALGGKLSFSKNTDVDPHLFTCSQGCFQIRVSTVAPCVCGCVRIRFGKYGRNFDMAVNFSKNVNLPHFCCG
jgi:hypothetical protein